MKNIVKCFLFIVSLTIPSLLFNENVNIKQCPFNNDSWCKISNSNTRSDKLENNDLVYSDFKNNNENNLEAASGCSIEFKEGSWNDYHHRDCTYYHYCIDGWDAQPGYIRLSGWIFAHNHNTNMTVRYYSGGADLTYFYYSNLNLRQDVINAYSLPSGLKTGFSFYVPLKAGTYDYIRFEAHQNNVTEYGEHLFGIKCTITKPTVSFDKQGGSGGSDSATVDYKSANPTITIPTRTGYTFQGYYTGTNGTGKKYYNADGTSANTYYECGSKTLYAYWTANEYSITYKDGDTILSELSPITYTYGVGATLPSKGIEKSGSSFVGWFDANEGGNKVTSISTTDTGDKVFYARYSTNPIGNGLGGFIKDGDNKKQVVMFGFTFDEYSKLDDGDTIGIYVYSDSGSTQVKDFSTTEVSAVKEKEGRFYCIYGENDTIVENATYYAKSYVIQDGAYIYSSFLSATGNYDTEYKI